MNECTEELSRRAALKHKVWLAAKANFIKFTPGRSEAVGTLMRGDALQMHRKLMEEIFLIHKSIETPQAADAGALTHQWAEKFVSLPA